MHLQAEARGSVLRYLIVPISLGLRPAGVPWRPLSPPSLLHSLSLPVFLLLHRCPGGPNVLFHAVAGERDDRLGVAGYDVFERRYVWPMTGRTAHAPAPHHLATHCIPIAELIARGTQANSTPLTNEQRLSTSKRRRSRASAAGQRLPTSGMRPIFRQLSVPCTSRTRHAP